MEKQQAVEPAGGELESIPNGVASYVVGKVSQSICQWARHKQIESSNTRLLFLRIQDVKLLRRRAPNLDWTTSPL